MIGWIVVASLLSAALAGVLVFLWLRPRLVLLAARQAEAEAARAAAERLREEHQAVHNELAAARCEIARLSQALEDARAHADARIAALTGDRQDLANQFQAIAAGLLAQTREQAGKEHDERLSQVVAPLREHLEAFRRQIAEQREKDQHERGSLHEQIRQLGELNRRMDDDARALTRALKGQAQMRGAWGEMVLERILEQSGLRPDEEYTVQEHFADGDDEHGARRPDVLVRMPNGQHVIIDSKLPLLHWIEVVNAEDEAAREAALHRLVAAVRGHVGDLSGKEYQTIRGLRSDDYVLLFVPIDALFLELGRADPQLFEEAYRRNVVLVCPSTLMATLRSVASAWRYERQQKNALTIAQEAGRLHDAVLRFLDSFGSIAQRLDQARSAYDEARNRLHSGRGNLLTRTRKLHQLGARTAKTMGVEWTQLIADDETAEPEDDQASAAGEDEA